MKLIQKKVIQGIMAEVPYCIFHFDGTYMRTSLDKSKVKICPEIQNQIDVELSKKIPSILAWVYDDGGLIGSPDRLRTSTRHAVQ